MTVQKKRKWISLWLILIGFCVPLKSCKSDKQIRHEQFVIAGKNLYLNHCANCHGKNGEGLRSLYPSLNRSGRLTETGYLACLIRNGSTGKTINMPANPGLYDIDIAQLITYLNDQWGTGKITETGEVAKAECPSL